MEIWLLRKNEESPVAIKKSPENGRITKYNPLTEELKFKTENKKLRNRAPQHSIIGGAQQQQSDLALAREIMEAVRNRKFVSKSARKNLHLVAGNKFIKKGKRGKLYKKLPFESFAGSTSGAIEEYSKKYPKAKISAMVYANSTRWGGGFYDGVRAQEEQTVRDIDPTMVCHLIGNGHIDKMNLYPAPQEYLDGIDAGEDKLSPLAGYMIDARLAYTNGVKNSKPAKFKALFAALPNLSGIDCDSTILARFLYGKTSKTTTAAYEDLLDDLQNNFSSISSVEEFQRALKIFMCSDKFSDPSGKTVADIIRCAKARKGTSDYKVYKNANRNYNRMLRKAIRTWIRMARASKIKYFIAGPVGCGVFGNDTRTVAKIFAEEFLKYGNGMTFVCAVPKAEKRQIFEKAFKIAFRKQLKKK